MDSEAAGAAMPGTRDSIRVLIADDHPVYRSGLAQLLGQDADIEVVGHADTGRRAVDLCAATNPDVILMDIAMPELDGIAATRQILDRNPQVAVLVLSMSEDARLLTAAMRAGARGYLLKEAGHDDIRRAVQALANGEAVFGARVAQQVLTLFRSDTQGRPATFPALSDREREVLELIARGWGNSRIGRALGITAKTVRNHASNIVVKLQVAGRAEAIVKAREAGLGLGEDPC